ncbi:MAG: thrombospondin type 3 repeat-containing protein, partial [Candidatus Saccharimonadales bacterium]
GMAGPIWRKSITSFLEGTRDEEFQRPAGIVEASLCRSNGYRATGNASNTYTEVFLSGTVPTKSCGETVREETKEPEENETNTSENQSNSDDDNDGVKNSKDLCPNTSSGIEVTSNGCPKPVAPPADDDNDGVLNSVDQCPNTPLDDGKTVDTTGCYVTVTELTTPPQQN